MDIKELGACGVFVVGGTVYGISQLGLNDVLSEDLRHISEVTFQERPAYMDTVVAEFTDAFATYGVETETYTYVGNSNFSTLPAMGTFVEVVRQDSPVPKRAVKGIKKQMELANFCDQGEMTMFTEKGWTYRFSMEDSNGLKVFAVVCKPVVPKLRGVSA